MENQLQSNKDLVIQLFKSVFEEKNPDFIKITQLLSSSYIQNVNGKVINYSDFISHIKAQRLVVDQIKIQFIDILSEGNKVSTHHIVDVYKKTGDLSKFEVFAIFTVQNNKVIACNELTRLISGSSDDEDLGSRT
ncbi:MAG: nuclear transport factor 2 family protein [Neisseriaceae bacterium]